MAQIAIDGEKLRQALFEKGVKPSKASTEIGFTENYWGKAMRRGCCSEIAAKALFAAYGIRLDEYAAQDDVMEAAPEEVKPEPTPCQTELTLDATEPANLREVIREAVLDAVVQIMADKGLGDALGRIIYGAVNGAITNASRVNTMLGR